MARMTAKYAGTCRRCRERFAAGTLIDFEKNARRGQKTAHVDCENPGVAVPDGTLALDFYGSEEEAARGVSYEVRTSGGTFYRNRNGLCEDAPCCGCCTF